MRRDNFYKLLILTLKFTNYALFRIFNNYSGMNSGNIVFEFQSLDLP